MDNGQWTSKKISNVKSQMSIVIGYLYGDLMNIYGDWGNIIALKKRTEDRGIEVVIKMFTIGNKLKKGDADIFFFGGGQDQQQELVAADLVKSGKGKVIKAEIERGVPLLSICGGYQLLGEYYKPHKGPRLPGINLFPTYTVANYDRMIGNIVIDSMFGTLVGFENHSGKTYLKKGGIPLGMVKKGFGNNVKDRTEGCIYKNAIGCYMHGSLLPKNPKLADWLIKKALEVKYGSPRFAPASTKVAPASTKVAGEAGKEIELVPLDDSSESRAHNFAVKRFS